MKRYSLTRKLLMALLPLVFLVNSPVSLLSADETQALKEEISGLKDRIAILEKQLAQKKPNEQSSRTDPFSGERSYSWDPFSEMQQMRQRMNQLFDESFDHGLGGASSGFLSPQTDIKAEDNRYIITLDIPGMDKESINVEVKNGTLVVSGQRSAQQESKGDKFYSQQRSFGQFLKTFPLPVDAKEDQLEARYDKGVLEIIVQRDAKSAGTGGKKVVVQ